MYLDRYVLTEVSSEVKVFKRREIVLIVYERSLRSYNTGVYDTGCAFRDEGVRFVCIPVLYERKESEWQQIGLSRKFLRFN